MGARTKNQIVLKKQKCGGFLFKIFEHESLIRSTNVALAGNVRGLCVRCLCALARVLASNDAKPVLCVCGG